jgi:hypothetical protein
MATIYLADIAESDFPEVARDVPCLLTPHASYIAQLAWREADWKADNPKADVIRVSVSLADVEKYSQSHGHCDAHDLTTLAGLKHEGKL